MLQYGPGFCFAHPGYGSLGLRSERPLAIIPSRARHLEDHMLRPFAVLALVLLASPAAAQDSWPSKPVTVIVPFGAGGNTDALARIYSARLSARLGQQFVIENRVGAGSIIGITSLAKAAPDGYTIGVGTSAGLAINPAIMKENLGYNADKDFAYLHLMAIQPNMLVVIPPSRQEASRSSSPGLRPIRIRRTPHPATARASTFAARC
jgi:Tripartite tricarboxylate transporter family receptor